MNLDILIPQYKEDDTIIKNLLDSISHQEDIDFSSISVIICNDGSDVHISKELLDSYPFKVEYHLEEHSGIAETRNKLLEHSESNYIMFCDSDDELMNSKALYNILNVKTDFDILWSDFYEELETGELHLIKEDKSHLHGKVISKRLLDEKDIWFNEEMNVNEDLCFLNLVYAYSTNTQKLEEPFYKWKYNSISITRSDNDFFWNNIKSNIDANKFTVETFLDNGDMSLAQQYFLGMIYTCYFMFNADQWLSVKNRVEVEKYFCQYIKKYSYVWRTSKNDFKKMMFDYTRNDVINVYNIDRDFKVQIEFDNWLKKIQKKYK